MTTSYKKNQLKHIISASLACLAAVTFNALAQLPSNTIELSSNGKTIKAEHIAAKQRRGVIILTDKLGHPKEPRLINPLRQQLSKRQWHTLALPLQADAAKNSALINAAMVFLNQQNCQQIVVLGHGLGGNMVLHYLAGQPNKIIKAAILLSAYPSNFDKKQQQSLTSTKLPIMDVTAYHDFDIAKSAFHQRQKMFINKSKQLYRHKEIISADHYYSRLSSDLAGIIHSWLRTNTATTPD